MMWILKPMKKIVFIFSLLIAIFLLGGRSNLIYANQNLKVPGTLLKFVFPERESFDEKIQNDFQELL